MGPGASLVDGCVQSEGLMVLSGLGKSMLGGIEKDILSSSGGLRSVTIIIIGSTISRLGSLLTLSVTTQWETSIS